MHAFILAGGFATRLWPLTEHRAKPLLPLAGKPMLTHIVEKIPREIPITVSTNAAFADAFAEWKNGIDRENLEIAVEQTLNDDAKLGTNGAVAQWITQQGIEDDLLLLTGDNYLGLSMQRFLDTFDSKNALLAAYDIGSTDAARSFGTVLTDDSNTVVTGFEEKPSQPKTSLVSTGCFVLPAHVLPTVVRYAATHPDHIGGVFEELLRTGNGVRCFRFQEPWFDIGSFDAYLAATRTLVGEQCLSDTTASLQRTETRGSVVVGPDCTVEDSVLENVVIFGKCRIRDCHLTDCILDEDCELESVDLTGKMLRSGTELRRK